HLSLFHDSAPRNRNSADDVRLQHHVRAPFGAAAHSDAIDRVLAVQFTCGAGVFTPAGHRRAQPEILDPVLWSGRQSCTFEIESLDRNRTPHRIRAGRANAHAHHAVLRYGLPDVPGVIGDGRIVLIHWHHAQDVFLRIAQRGFSRLESDAAVTQV